MNECHYTRKNTLKIFGLNDLSDVSSLECSLSPACLLCVCVYINVTLYYDNLSRKHFPTSKA